MSTNPYEPPKEQSDPVFHRRRELSELQLWLLILTCGPVAAAIALIVLIYIARLAHPWYR
jgi:hypothetical protein